MRNEFKENLDIELTPDAEEAQKLLDRICSVLEKKCGCEFFIENKCWNDYYEAHVICKGKCVELEDGSLRISSTEGEDVGMIFFGGHYSIKEHADARSLAIVSLLEDCIGQSCDEDIRQCHNLTEVVKRMFNIDIDFNCENFNELGKLLDKYESEVADDKQDLSIS